MDNNTYIMIKGMIGNEEKNNYNVNCKFINFNNCFGSNNYYK